MDAMFKKVFRLALVCFLVGAVGLVYYFQKNQTWYSGMEPVNEQRTVQEQVKSLELDTATVDLDIVAGDRSDIGVRLSGEVNRKRKDALRLITEMRGDGTLYIAVKEPNHLGFSFGPDHDLRLEVIIPNRELERITVKSNTGDVHASALTAGVSSFETDTGDLALEGIKGNHLQATSHTGDLQLRQIEAKVDVGNDTGDVKIIDLAELKQDITIQTATGDVSIDARNTPAAAQIDLMTDTGDVNVKWSGLDYQEKDESEVRATIGTGGPRIEVSSSTGDISIR